MKALLLLLTSSLLFADEKTLPFTRVSAEQDLQEIATIVRIVVEPSQSSIEGKTLKVQGSAELIATAEWIVRELDQPSGGFERVLGDDDIVRIFEFNDAKTLQEFQESATVVRSMGQIPRLVTFNSARKIVARGPKAQMEQTAWLFARLPSSAGSDTAELKIANEREPVLRVYTLPQFATTQEFQEVATVIRSVGEVRNAFTYNPTRKLALRGTTVQMAITDFILKELGAPSDTGMMHKARPGDSVRVFDYAKASGTMALQEMATAMRTMIGSPRLFALNSRKKIILRGAPEDMELGEWMLSQDGGKGTFQLGAVREFRLPFAPGIQEFQEAATVARSLGEIHRLMAQNETKTVFVRGSQAQIDLADWIFRVLGTPPAAGLAETAYGPDKVKVMFLKSELPLAEFQQKAVEARRESKIPRMFTYNKARAIFIRGTAEQVAQAETSLLRQ